MSLPPIEIPLGAMRFNSDSSKFEYWMGSAWMQIVTEPASLFGGEVFFTMGGANKYTQTFNIITGGTAVNIDVDQLTGLHSGAAVNSKTRGVTMGGRANPSPYAQSNVIQFFEFVSRGNYADFGDLTESKGRNTGHGDPTRGLSFGKQNAGSNVIEFITIASKGNGTDFGDSTQAREMGTAIGNRTRGCHAGGNTPGDNHKNTIDFVTIQSLGNAVDFGDEQETIYSRGGMSNSTRGLLAGGYGGTDTRIEMITIHTTGNAVTFGDLVRGGFGRSGTSSPITGVTASGTSGQTDIEKVTLATLGDSVDFGDLVESATYGRGMSPTHGGMI
tara:strand:- start:1 stop:990 length:990 start_codon:yes stop_codon:yes gene_type:complete